MSGSLDESVTDRVIRLYYDGKVSAYGTADAVRRLRSDMEQNNQTREDVSPDCRWMFDKVMGTRRVPALPSFKAPEGAGAAFSEAVREANKASAGQEMSDQVSDDEKEGKLPPGAAERLLRMI